MLSSVTKSLLPMCTRQVIDSSLTQLTDKLKVSMLVLIGIPKCKSSAFTMHMKLWNLILIINFGNIVKAIKND